MSDIKMEELHPTYQQFGKVIGVENALKLGKEFGGESVYFPKLDSHMSPSVKVRNRRIVEEFKSLSVPELAKKYGLTSAFIYEILRNARKKTLKNG